MSYITEHDLRAEIEADIDSITPEELADNATYFAWDMVFIEAAMLAEVAAYGE